MSSVLYKAVEFEIQLTNLKDFTNFLSEIFYVQGQPWKFKFYKSEPVENGCGYSSLEVNLQSKRVDKSDHWAMAAHFSVKLISANLHQICRMRIGTAVFHSSCLNWGLNSIIKWDDFLDPESGYIVNDTCRIQVKVEASPLQDLNHCLKVESLKRCCDKGSFAHLRYIINIADDFIGVATPDLKLRGSSWRIFLSKTNPILDPILRICLYNNISTACRDITKSFTCKIISFDPNVPPVEMKVENKIFSTASRVHYLDLMNWNDFIKPEKRFIENQSFAIEIEMEVDHGDECFEGPLKRGADDGGANATGNNVQLECAICLESLVGRVISTTKCGHMFCDSCIRVALQRKKTCPICNKKLTLAQLYQTFLPIKN